MNSTYLLLCEYKVCWYIYTLKSEPRCKQDKPLEIREDRYIFYLKYCHLAIFPVSCLGEKCSVLVQSCTFSVLLRAVNFTLQLQQVTAQLPKMYFQIQHPPGPECSEVRLIFHWLPPHPSSARLLENLHTFCQQTMVTRSHSLSFCQVYGSVFQFVFVLNIF